MGLDMIFHLEGMFASKSRARIIQIRAQLTSAKKKGTPPANYFWQMKTLADTLIAIGQPLHPDETIVYILSSLGPDYDTLVTSLTTRNDELTLDEVYAHLLSFEHRHGLHDAETTLAMGGQYFTNYSRRQQGGGHPANPNRGGNQGSGLGNQGGQGGGRGHGQGHGNGGRGAPPQGRGVAPQNWHHADDSEHATIYMMSLWKCTTKRLVHVATCTRCGWNRVATVTQFTMEPTKEYIITTKTPRIKNPNIQYKDPNHT
jgi:hypothetical protein